MANPQQPTSYNLTNPLVNETCPELPSPFYTICCGVCRLICKYENPGFYDISESNDGDLFGHLDPNAVIPSECPNCSHAWTSSTADNCWLCHHELFTPMWICSACSFPTDFWMDTLCGSCKMPYDGSCTLVWARRDIEYIDSVNGVIARVDLMKWGKLVYRDEVDDSISARQREVERRGSGVRSHLHIV